ncbi:hypothetical protein LX32DRAFT_697160 [Colletotrichum zoysiae]|uniref:Uncharacterized protein n=1 Tax=Colletotrichum zoysiae TaxID=1216348 RepID=A0AAD9H9V3_9PEZI|nr:hypothetical protein LX32DRAFT_697160 [Colletotrichum zoysiae]
MGTELPRVNFLKPTSHSSSSFKMPAVNSIIARDAVHQLAKRKNWASQEAGVIVVFCIVFVVALGVAGLLISRCLSRRKAKRQAAQSSA